MERLALLRAKVIINSEYNRLSTVINDHEILYRFSHDGENLAHHLKLNLSGTQHASVRARHNLISNDVCVQL